MFHHKNVFDIEEGQILRWFMDGQPGVNANIPFSLQLRFVQFENGTKGLFFDPAGTDVPSVISVHASFKQAVNSQSVVTEDESGYEDDSPEVFDVVIDGDRGVTVMFRGDTYELFTFDTDKLVAGERAVLYFHTYVPQGLGESHGRIVYTETQVLEKYVKPD